MGDGPTSLSEGFFYGAEMIWFGISSCFNEKMSTEMLFRSASTTGLTGHI